MKEYGVFQLKYTGAHFNVQVIAPEEPAKCFFKTKEEAEKWISEQNAPEQNYYYTILEVFHRYGQS
jgi:hypothetical protein